MDGYRCAMASWETPQLRLLANSELAAGGGNCAGLIEIGHCGAKYFLYSKSFMRVLEVSFPTWKQAVVAPS